METIAIELDFFDPVTIRLSGISTALPSKPTVPATEEQGPPAPP